MDRITDYIKCYKKSEKKCGADRFANNRTCRQFLNIVRRTPRRLFVPRLLTVLTRGHSHASHSLRSHSCTACSHSLAAASAATLALTTATAECQHHATSTAPTTCYYFNIVYIYTYHHEPRRYSGLVIAADTTTSDPLL